MNDYLEVTDKLAVVEADKKRIAEIRHILDHDPEYESVCLRRKPLFDELKTLTENLNAAKAQDLLPAALKGVMGLEETGIGYYKDQIYCDRGDQVPDDTLCRLLESDDDLETAFSESIEEAYEPAWSYDFSRIKEDVREYLQKNDVDVDELPALMIEDYITEHVEFVFPEDELKSQTVCANIVIDTGDANRDYTINAQYPSTAYNAVRPLQPGEDGYEPYDPEEYIPKEAGIAWLAATQGYTRRELHEALMNDELVPEDPFEPQHLTFLQSMRVEMENNPSSMPCVAFFVEMTVGDLLRLNSLLRKMYEADGKYVYDADLRTDVGSIILDKNTRTGLFDIFSGAGSLLDIQLERDIELPIRYIRSITPDMNNCLGIRWSIKEVYGMSRSFWKPTMLDIREKDLSETVKKEEE